jgi:hypothetical protein
MQYWGQKTSLVGTLWSLLFLSLSIALISPPGLAQTGRGVIRGTVLDRGPGSSGDHHQQCD